MPLPENIERFSSNKHQIQRYLKFIKSSNGSGEVSHHILPRSMFPEFVDLKKFEWNECKLSERHHFIAHLMLVKVFDNKEMRYAFNMMSNFNSIDSKLYENLRNKFKEDLREDVKSRDFGTKGQVTVKDRDGNTFNVKLDDPRYLNGELVGATKGNKRKDFSKRRKKMVIAKDINGKIIEVSQEEFRLRDDLYGVRKDLSKLKGSN